MRYILCFTRFNSLLFCMTKLLVLILLLLASCKRDFSQKKELKNDDSYFSYDGNDANIKSIISKLKALDSVKHFTKKIEGSLDWNKTLLGYSLQNDSSKSFTVPLLGSDNLVKNYLTIKLVSGQISLPEISQFNSFTNNYYGLIKKLEYSTVLNRFSKLGLNAPSMVQDYVNRSHWYNSLDESLESPQATNNNAASCSVSFVGYFGYSTSCSDGDTGNAIRDAIVTELNRIYLNDPNITKIENSPIFGITITGNSSWLGSNINTLINRMYGIVDNIHAPCVVQGTVYLLDLNVVGNCASDPDGSGADLPDPNIPPTELISSESDYVIVCPTNFSFVSVTVNNVWQESLLTNIYCNLFFLRLPTFEVYNSKRVEIPRLFFGVPYYVNGNTLRYTHQQAANFATQALNRAEMDMRKEYKKRPALSGAQLANYWVGRIDYYMRSQTNNAGKADRTGSINATEFPPSREYTPCL